MCDDDVYEWDSVSQIEGFSETSPSMALADSISSSVWIYFEKSPTHAPDYNICKKCSKQYKLLTSMTSLRKHLRIHQLTAPTRTEKIEKKINNPFNKQEQKEHDKYLVQWLIRDLQPFTVIDDPSFRAFVNSLCSH